MLVLMAISAALVLPALRLPDTLNVRGDSPAATTTAVDVLMTGARKIAIRRGEPVHLRVESDGVWAIVPAKGGDAIQAGRLTEPLLWLPDVTIDAIGVCVLHDGVLPRAGARAWDALACRWLESKS